MAGRTFRGAAVLVLLAATLSAPTAASGSDAKAGVSAVDALETQILSGVNALRRARGLPTLRLSEPLTAAAEAHSRAMARRGQFAHELPGGPSFTARLRRFYPQNGYRHWIVGENIAAMSPSLEAGEAIDMWMESPPHRRNLLSREWREIGLSAVHAASAPGMFGGDEATFVTADFGARTAARGR